METADSYEKTAYIEIPYPGDQCPLGVYMVEVVEEAVKKFGKRVCWKKVVLKRRNGTMRFAELSKKNKIVAPIPSLFINEKLAFDTIPPVEKLEKYLEDTLR